MIDMKDGRIAIWINDCLLIVEIADDCLKVDAEFPDSAGYPVENTAALVKKTMKAYLRLPDDE